MYLQQTRETNSSPALRNMVACGWPEGLSLGRRLRIWLKGIHNWCCLCLCKEAPEHAISGDSSALSTELPAPVLSACREISSFQSASVDWALPNTGLFPCIHSLLPWLFNVLFCSFFSGPFDASCCSPKAVIWHWEDWARVMWGFSVPCLFVCREIGVKLASLFCFFFFFPV